MNPALADLGVLVGNWTMELSNASFLPPNSPPTSGPASFEWVQGGAFLALYMGEKPPGTPNALWLISRDQSAANYTVLYYDARSVSRVYAMSFVDGVWKMWRDTPKFSQRFEATLSEDGKTISGRWEKAVDGGAWEHDFDVTYTTSH